MTDAIIRPMAAGELDVAIDWAAAEGWNPGIADADPFLAADREGFLGLFLADGSLAASISVVRWSGRFGFLGFYIVRPDCRGRGLGLRLWEAGMAHLGARTVGLDGVVAQQENYRRSGFALAFRNVRYGGPAPATGAPDPGLVPVDEALRAAVVAYDQPFFPARRDGFLARWLDGPSRRSMAMVRDGEVRGYGTIRPCRVGHKIGPLFADDEATADALFRALVAPHPGEPVFLDPPEPNGRALALAARHGLSPVFETARMYRGPAPDLPLDRIFGVTSFELG